MLFKAVAPCLWRQRATAARRTSLNRRGWAFRARGGRGVHVARKHLWPAERHFDGHASHFWRIRVIALAAPRLGQCHAESAYPGDGGSETLIGWKGFDGRPA